MFPSDQLLSTSGTESDDKAEETPPTGDSGPVTLDPPPTKQNKANKMAKLKKAVADRRPQRQEDIDSEVLSNLSSIDTSDMVHLNVNTNNNNNNDREVTTRRKSLTEIQDRQQRDFVSKATASSTRRVKSAVDTRRKAKAGERIPTVVTEEKKPVIPPGAAGESSDSRAWNFSVESGNSCMSRIQQRRSGLMHLRPNDTHHSATSVTLEPISGGENAWKRNDSTSFSHLKELSHQQAETQNFYQAHSVRRHSCTPHMQHDYHHLSSSNSRRTADPSDESTLC